MEKVWIYFERKKVAWFHQVDDVIVYKTSKTVRLTSIYQLLLRVSDEAADEAPNYSKLIFKYQNVDKSYNEIRSELRGPAEDRIQCAREVMKGYYLKTNGDYLSDEKQFSTYLPVVIDGVRIIKSKNTGKQFEYCVPKRCLQKIGEKEPSHVGAILILITGGDPYCKWLSRKELQEILPVVNVVNVKVMYCCYQNGMYE